MENLIKTVNFFLEKIDKNALNNELETASKQSALFTSKHFFYINYRKDKYSLIALKAGMFEKYVESEFNRKKFQRDAQFQHRLGMLGKNKFLVNMLIFENDTFVEICAKTVINNANKMINIKIVQSDFPTITVKVKSIKGE